MKHILTGAILALILTLTGCEKAIQTPEDLPWNAALTPEGNVEVFQIEVGKSTLREMIKQFQSFPEIAVFTSETGKRTLEAYFGKRRLGVFEARIVAELQASADMKARFEAEHAEREGMASGLWKHTLSEANVKIANDLPVTKLVYMPTVNYDDATAIARFGEPAERLPARKEGVAYWFYPDKGLAIMMNSDGSDILYYTPKNNYATMKQDLLEAKPVND